MIGKDKKYSLIKFPKTMDPLLLVFVDTEEDFDWAAPFSRSQDRVDSIKFLYRGHKLLAQHGIKPTYLVDYAVVNCPEGYGPLLELSSYGSSEIGAQMHPWVNPPFEEDLTIPNSFVGNLTYALEYRKLETLTLAIEKNLRVRPTTFRAGRYGIGPNSLKILSELGYRIDVSVFPKKDYSDKGGPNFREYDAQPFWTGEDHEILEIPVSSGFTGLFREYGDKISCYFEHTVPRTLRPQAIASRLKLLNQVQISPEGVKISEAQALTRALIRDGYRIISLNFHSTSLNPGSNPYVRTESDLEALLMWVEDYIEFFTAEIRGKASTPKEVFELAKRLAKDEAEPSEWIKEEQPIRTVAHTVSDQRVLADNVKTEFLNSPIIIVGGKGKTDQSKTEEWLGFEEARILSIDPISKKGRLVVSYKSPSENCPEENPSIVFKAATVLHDRIFACTQTEILEISRPDYQIRKAISLPFFNDLHHVLLTKKNTLLVAVTGLDVVAELSPQGEILNMWPVSSFKIWQRFSPSTDYRKVQTTKPHLCHPNYLFEIGDEYWVTRFNQQDAICITDFEKRINLEIGYPHDGQVLGEEVYFTTVDGKIVVCSARTRETVRVVDLTNLVQSSRPLGWCRGLKIVGDGKIIVGTTRLRRSTIGDNIFWAKNKIKTLVGMEEKTWRLPTMVICVDTKENKILWKINIEPFGMNAIFSIH